MTPIALPPIRVKSPDAPFTGGVGGFVVRAWAAETGISRPPPPVTQVAGTNLYRVEPTDDDESVGVIVEVDVGSANVPRYNVVTVTSATRANQSFGYGLYNPDGSRWTGTGGTVSAWTGTSSLVLAKLDDGVFVGRISAGDITAGAQGLIDAPTGARPPQLSVSTEALGSGSGGGGGGGDVPEPPAPNRVYVSVVPTAGSCVDESAKLIKKHFHLSGLAWDSLIDALATGDCYHVSTAKKAFDQLFITSASGTYLDRLVGDRGLRRPEGVGLSDDSFRSLAVAFLSEQLTIESLWRVLEVFYGSAAVRATMTSSYEPWDLRGNPKLMLKVSGKDVAVQMHSDVDFADATLARAYEVAAVFNRAFISQGLAAWAEVAVDREHLNETSVVIYDEAVGPRSSLSCVGGSAQLQLLFPTELQVYSGSPAGYSWVVTVLTGGKLRVSLTMTPPSNVDLTLVRDGDYVLFNVPTSTIAAGTYKVQDVSVSYLGADLVQSFVIQASASTHSFTQSNSDEMAFFRPTIQRPRGNLSLVQDDSGLFVKLPATTEVVDRSLGEAAYLQGAEPVAVSGLSLRGRSLTVSTSTPHGLLAGGSTLLEECFLDTEPVVTAGDPSTSGNPGTSDYSAATIWTQLRAPDIHGTKYAVVCTTASKKLMVIGGYWDYFGANYLSDVEILSVSSTNIDAYQKQYTYEWTTAASYPVPIISGAVCLTSDGVPLVTGGGPDGITATRECYLYDEQSDSWGAAPSMLTIRYRHTQTLLPDGQILVIGGNDGTTGPLSSCELFDGTSWSFAASMSQPHVGHSAVLLLDGRVLVIGDASGGGSPSCEVYDPSTNTWAPTGSMCFIRSQSTATLLPDGRVLVVGGSGYNATRPTAPASISAAEVYDPTTGQWNSAGKTLPRAGHGAQLFGDYVYVSGGGAVPQKLDTRSMRWSLVRAGPSGSSANQYLNSVGDVLVSHGGYTVDGDTVPAFLFQPAEDSTTTGFVNGIFKVLDVPTTSSFVVESVFAGASSGSTGFSRAMAAPQGSGLGPFIIDPVAGLAITGVESETTEELEEGQQYGLLHVADATVFPDEPGWLVLSYGFESQVGPFRYIGRYDNTTLITDYDFRHTATNAVGSKLTLLVGRTPFPTSASEKPGLFYLTGSSAGRVAAEALIRSMVAAGTNVNVEVLYPDDRGLGGAGLPTRGAQVLSDIVSVYAGDSVSDEVQTARES